MDRPEAYPPWGERRRLPLAEARRSERPVPVAGRWSRGPNRDLLADASAVVEVETVGDRPGHGDLVHGWLGAGASGGRLRVDRLEVLAPARRELTRELREVAAQRPLLEARAAALAALRAYFAAEGFLEVETPARVANPGLEPHLRPFPAGRGDDGGERWLITSPELQLKRLLAAGYERVFELARAFRDDERGDLHLSEFTLLEWYRAWAGLGDLGADIAALLPLLAVAVGRDPRRAVTGTDLTLEPEHVTYAEAFRRHAGRDPWDLAPDERERTFVAAVEPRLGFGRPLLVGEFPPDGAALARLQPASAPGGLRQVAARMELYVAGIELGNAFDELNDPDEQRRRHGADRAARAAAGAPAPPLDEGFLAALEAGMPPSAGMALGVDRLLLLLTGAPSLHRVRAFAG